MFQLSEEWENKQANAYPQLNLNIMTWPAETMAISKEQREENKENRIMSNEGDIVADKGGCSHMIETAATLVNDNGSGQQEPTRNPNLFLPEPIDLATTGQMIGMDSKAANESNCENGGSMLPGKMDEQQSELQQLTDGTSNFVHPLALAAAAPDTKVFYFQEAMHEPVRDKFVQVMVKEIDDLNKAQVWELEEHDKIGQHKKIIKAIWSFK